MDFIVTNLHCYVVAWFMFLFFFKSGVLCGPSCHVNITNVTCYNNRKGREWELTFRTVTATTYLSLSIRNGFDVKFLVCAFPLQSDVQEGFA